MTRRFADGTYHEVCMLSLQSELLSPLLQAAGCWRMMVLDSALNLFVPQERSQGDHIGVENMGTIKRMVGTFSHKMPRQSNIIIRDGCIVETRLNANLTSYVQAQNVNTLQKLSG